MSEIKRYFSVDCGITYTVIATNPFHAISIIHDIEQDFGLNLIEYGGLNIVEFSEDEAANRHGSDDERNGGLYPINTFPLGAVLSSEY